MDDRKFITLKERLEQIKKGGKYRSIDNQRLKKLASIKKNNRKTSSVVTKLKNCLIFFFHLGQILILKISSFIVNIFRGIRRSFVASKNEPQIEQKRDRHGNLYWQVYDFTNNKSYTFDSSRDVRAWSEERYNRF